MSNSNRNPKSIKELIDKSKMDYEFNGASEIEESLKNLRNLSQEEKTEQGMLKSRIEEQSRLIMSLKQRADDFIRKNMSFEKLNQELHDRNEQCEQEIKQTNAKFKDLLDKFNYLGNNHEQLIVIKDEYKHKNEELNVKYKALLDKIHGSPSEKEFAEERNRLNEKIENLNKSLIEMELKYKSLSKENDKRGSQLMEETQQLKLKTQENQELSRQLAEMCSKSDEYKTRNKDLMDLNTHLENDSKQSNEKHLKRIAELGKEKEDLYTLCEKLKQELKVSLDNQMHLEKNYMNVSQELNKLKETYSKNSLHAELRDAQKKYNDLQMQFDAYKRHTNNLLDKERELNNKLKFMLN